MGIPKGTRDFSPVEMIRRDYIFDTIRKVFRLYGYQPLETPAMENLSTLLGKYGEEGDKLIFRILNSGDFLSDLSDKEILSREAAKLSSRICEKGLRYDLTVPFARYVVQHQNEIVFPFKRYQIQPVWRADRPQKGRYREFFQCDVDVIGSDSLLNEIELIKIIDNVFDQLGIRVQIRINNRKILSGIAEYAGVPDRVTDVTIALDKLDKIGWENVREELISKRIESKIVDEFGNIVKVINKSNSQKIGFLNSILLDSVEGKSGLQEINEFFELVKKVNIKSEIIFDLTLARGLNYYTGAIIEVKSSEVSIGSICGGGRYDDLTGIFGLKGVSGVGVSFGADRIYDVMTTLGLFDADKSHTSTVMIVNFGGTETTFGLSLLQGLHEKGINAEIYPDAVKMKKQLSWADSKKIPFVVIAGDDEIRTNEVTVKNMETGEQQRMEVSGLGSFILSH